MIEDLVSAIDDLNVEEAERLLFEITDVDEEDGEDWTPLQSAAFAGCLPIAKLLLEKRKAKVDKA